MILSNQITKITQIGTSF